MTLIGLICDGNYFPGKIPIPKHELYHKQMIQGLVVSSKKCNRLSDIDIHRHQRKMSERLPKIEEVKKFLKSDFVTPTRRWIGFITSIKPQPPKLEVIVIFI